MRDPLESKNGKPVFPMSVTDMSANKTGSWRFMRPLYNDKIPVCTKGCPAGEKIPQYFAFVKEKRYKDAWHVILEDNPLPGICGRVCYHPCEDICNRKDFDTAIGINSMERFVADKNLKNNYPKKFFVEKTGKKIAIIGSGPAGLSAAYQLARKGHHVKIYEALSKPGGMLQMGIPKYRLPREILNKEINDIKSLGVEIETSCSVGTDIKWNELTKNFNAVLVATGATKSRSMNIPGEGLIGVTSGLKFLKNFNLDEKAKIGKKLVIVGGGNTAIDCARSAIRLGSDVTIVYRRSRKEMPAVAEEINDAEAEGVNIKYLTNPLGYIGNGKIEKIKVIKMKLGKVDKDGRRKPVEIKDSEYEIDADQVMLAIGEIPELSFLPDSIDEKWGRVNIDSFQMTDEKGVFACGDAANGPIGTVVDAIATGKRSAFAIHAFLTEQSYMPVNYDKVVNFEDLNLNYFVHQERARLKRLSHKVAVKNFDEVINGITEEDAIREAERCFSCGTCSMCDNCLVFCPDVAITRDAEGKGYIINYDYCKGCGLCVHECPRDAMDFEEELKWQIT